ncbi:MAG TPA: 3-dehydroquinate synthase [Woeseiaceae bacterium]|nr:3-dehydroquinate synthase [Woeseiaceae bacterium]
MQPSHTITVDLGDRRYPILIGSGLVGGYDLSPFIEGPDCLIVTNETVGPLYLERLKKSLGGHACEALCLPDGECHKTLAAAESIFDALAAMRAGRDATVVALGGGVVGDIAGFAAACYMRGIPFVQAPTTLLAQVDASIGGKTGVNHREGKNLIGAFHQPRAVLIDTGVLDTLPDREFRAGLAEVVKHAAIADAEFFAWLEANVGALLDRDAAALGEAIGHCCEIKSAVVAADEKEQGLRALLNFGHTFGHAIENALGYGEWLHGEAVAAGMVMATELSGIDPQEGERLRRLLTAAGLPIAPPDHCRGGLRAAMDLDKKNRRGRLRFVLLRAIGDAYLASDYSESRLDSVIGPAGAEPAGDQP